jgi:hypothetical protein
MDQRHFDLLARRAAASITRRNSFGLALAGLVSAIAPGHAVAKGSRKPKKKNRPRRNAFGCVDVGERCNGNDDLCCSGICQGSKPRKGQPDRSVCVAHDELRCEPGQDDCRGVRVECGTSGRRGFCFRTTGKAGFCGSAGDCAVCRKDVDCIASHGTGSACVVCPNCPQTGNTACMPAGFLE